MWYRSCRNTDKFSFNIKTYVAAPHKIVPIDSYRRLYIDFWRSIFWIKSRLIMSYVLIANKQNNECLILLSNWRNCRNPHSHSFHIFTQQLYFCYLRTSFFGWGFDALVTSLVISMKLPLEGSTPREKNLFPRLTSHTGQLNLAIPLWVDTVNTGQVAVMLNLCGWGVKVDMACIWWQVSEHHICLVNYV